MASYDTDQSEPLITERRASVRRFEKFFSLGSEGGDDDDQERIISPRNNADSGNSSMRQIRRLHKSKSSLSRVEQSWYLISDRIGEVGLKFFLKLFEEHPEIIDLFPFGNISTIDGRRPSVKQILANPSTRAHIRAHAIAVMRVVGTCVAGLTDLEQLIPRLRQVGATHATVGVKDLHYDILYRYIVRAIREEVGPEKWDEETEQAWEQAFTSISDLIKRPSKRLETEPLHGWGVCLLWACLYFAVVTPFRLAGFLYEHRHIVRILDVLDAFAALVLAIDCSVFYLMKSRRIRQISQAREWSIVNQNGSSVAASITDSMRSQDGGEQTWMYQQQQTKIVKFLQSMGMDQWMPWPSMDVRVLLSFPLQWIFSGSQVHAQLGLHWTHLFGLVRIMTIVRVVHFMTCAENHTILVQHKIKSADTQNELQLAKLILRLVYITHVSACLWCTLARVELGVHATDFQTSSFFAQNLWQETSVWNAYSRAQHWAFVNLSGIGNVESIPTTSLECWFTMLVHLIGAIFYAVLTGVLINILEDSSKKDGKIGEEIVKLSSFMKTARVAKNSKERIMNGYVLKNVLTSHDHVSNAHGHELDEDLNDDILQTLPRYLRMEVSLYARAELIRRHDKFFTHCSNGFLVALSSSLSQQRTLLTGDYLIQRGETMIQEFVLIEHGTLQVRRNSHTLKTLVRGDCLGISWLLQLKNDSKDSEHYEENTDWLRPDGTSAVSIRATSPVTLLTGISTMPDIHQLERGYDVDFKLMRAELRAEAMDETERRAIAMKGIAKAVRRFKMRRKARALSSENHSRESVQTILKKSESIDEVNDEALHQVVQDLSFAPSNSPKDVKRYNF